MNISSEHAWDKSFLVMAFIKSSSIATRFLLLTQYSEHFKCSIYFHNLYFIPSFSICMVNTISSPKKRNIWTKDNEIEDYSYFYNESVEIDRVNWEKQT